MSSESATRRLPSASAADAVTQPLVSVIISTYNRRELVLRAVDSVLAQTYRRYELIVVDDGSTDGTGEAIARRSEAMQYLYQPNRGLASARNHAIRQSRGELVALLDSDDWWTEDKLQRCVDYLLSHPEVDVVYSPMQTVDQDGRPMRGHDKPCLEGDLLEELFEEIFICDPAAVMWRQVWERVGGFNEALPVCVGHDFWLKVAVEHRFGLIPEPLAVRMWLPDSLTREKRSRGAKLKARMLEDFYENAGICDRLNSFRARRALARAFYSAGKACTREGDARTGSEFLRRALQYRPGWHKAWAFYLWTAAKRDLGPRLPRRRDA